MIHCFIHSNDSFIWKQLLLVLQLGEIVQASLLYHKYPMNSNSIVASKVELSTEERKKLTLFSQTLDWLKITGMHRNYILYIAAVIHHTSQHQRACCPARPLWPHLWLAKKSIAMAECSGSSYNNSLKSWKTSVQWPFSYWWPILEWRQWQNSALTS